MSDQTEQERDEPRAQPPGQSDREQAAFPASGADKPNLFAEVPLLPMNIEWRN
jgi:hypothetical protein